MRFGAHRWAFFIFEFFRKIDIIKIGGQKENKAGIKFIFTKSQYKFSRFFIFFLLNLQNGGNSQ